MIHGIRTCLWFQDGRGPEAAAFYCDLIPGSRVERSHSFDNGQGGQSSITDFSLGGVPFQILDAGPWFQLTEAVSISVETEDQAESDRLWHALTADGGEESMCGWLKDRFGVSWQVFPKRLTELTLHSDAKVAGAAMAAMMQQKRIDIAAIEAAVAAGIARVKAGAGPDLACPSELTLTQSKVTPTGVIISTCKPAGALRTGSF